MYVVLRDASTKWIVPDLVPIDGRRPYTADRFPEDGLSVFDLDGYTLDFSEERNVGFLFGELVGKTLFQIHLEYDQLGMKIVAADDAGYTVAATRDGDVVQMRGGDDVIDDGSASASAPGDDLYGGGGDDTYIVRSDTTIVIEEAYAEPFDGYSARFVEAGGTDRVMAFVDSYALTPGVENLTLAGAARVGTGNELANRIAGNARDNALSGGAGDDVLIGAGGADTLASGPGADLFFFDGATGRDRIVDFANSDVLVTTVALRDANRDGQIGFGKNKLLDLGGGGNSVAITGADGRAVTTLEFDGAFVEGDRTFYVYSLLGSAVGVDDAVARGDGDLFG